MSSQPLIVSQPALVSQQPLAAYSGHGGLALSGLGGYPTAGLTAGGLTAGGYSTALSGHGGLPAGLTSAGLQAGLQGYSPYSGLYSSSSLLGSSAGDYMTYTMSPTGGLKLMQNPYDPYSKAMGLSSGGLISNPLNAAAGFAGAASMGGGGLAAMGGGGLAAMGGGGLAAMGGGGLAAMGLGGGLSASPLSLARLHGGAVGLPMGAGLSAGGVAGRPARVYKGTESGISLYNFSGRSCFAAGLQI